MMGLLDGLLRCENDGMPMLRIGEYYRCVAEYLDSHIGGPEITITDLITDPVTLIFSNGYSLPLICACCGRPMELNEDDTTLALEQATGLSLLGIGWSENAPNELALHLGTPDDEDDPGALVVHLNTARQLQGPGL